MWGRRKAIKRLRNDKIDYGEVRKATPREKIAKRATKGKK